MGFICSFFVYWFIGFIVCWTWLFDFNKLTLDEYTKDQIKSGTLLSFFSWIMIIVLITDTIFKIFDKNYKEN